MRNFGCWLSILIGVLWLDSSSCSEQPTGEPEVISGFQHCPDEEHTLFWSRSFYVVCDLIRWQCVTGTRPLTANDVQEADMLD